MLITPPYTRLYKNKTPGAVLSNSHAGYFLRRRAFPVQKGGSAQKNWRAIFNSAQRNWASFGPLGSNYVAAGSLYPQDAWALMNAKYFGIVKAGFYINNVQTQATLGNCESGQQYYAMVQAMRGSLGLADLDTPVFSGTQVNPPTLPISIANGSLNIISESTQPNQHPPCGALLSILFYFSPQVQVTVTATIQTPPTGVTAVWQSTGTDTFTATGPNPGGVQNVLVVTIDPDYAVGTLPISVDYDANGVTGTAVFNFAVIDQTLQPVTPPPYWATPKYLFATTILDTDLNVTDIQLEYMGQGTGGNEGSRWGDPAGQKWLITASDAYSLSGSAPSTSTWKPITYNGTVYTATYNQNQPPNPPTDGILAAWVAKYGALPNKGRIKFQVQPYDPVTFDTGPALSCTAQWETGTFKGSDLYAWQGNLWLLGTPTETYSVTTPGTITVNMTFQPSINGSNPIWPGSYSFPRTFTFSLVSKTAIPNGANNTSWTKPSGLTDSFSPATLTFNADTDPAQSVALTLDYDATVPGITYTYKIETTDGVFVNTITITVTVTNSAVTVPPVNYLTMSPVENMVTISGAGTYTFPLTLLNEGDVDIQAEMLFTQSSDYAPTIAALASTPYELTWDNSTPLVPAGTPSSPGSITINCTLVVPPNIATDLVVTQIIASAGNNTTYGTL